MRYFLLALIGIVTSILPCNSLGAVVGNTTSNEVEQSYHGMDRGMKKKVVPRKKGRLLSRIALKLVQKKNTERRRS